MILLFCIPLYVYAGGNPHPDKTKSGSNVKVYDSDGQHLGILLGSGYSIDNIDIYLPSIKKLIAMRTDDGDIAPVIFFFESNDCSTQPYVGSSTQYRVQRHSGLYYTGAMNVPIKMRAYSYKRGEDESVCGFTDTYLYGIEAVEVILPFTVPVALPLFFE
jgi:hypothetical protein